MHTTRQLRFIDTPEQAPHIQWQAAILLTQDRHCSHTRNVLMPSSPPRFLLSLRLFSHLFRLCFYFVVHGDDFSLQLGNLRYTTAVSVSFKYRLRTRNVIRQSIRWDRSKGVHMRNALRTIGVHARLVRLELDPSPICDLVREDGEDEDFCNRSSEGLVEARLLS